MRIGKALMFLDKTKDRENDLVLSVRLRLLVKSHEDWIALQASLGRDVSVIAPPH